MPRAATEGIAHIRGVAANDMLCSVCTSQHVMPVLHLVGLVEAIPGRLPVVEWMA